MTMSPSEFVNMVSKNPQLMARNREKVIQYIDKEIETFRQKVEEEKEAKQKKTEKPKKKAKYRNVKIYLYEDGFASENANETEHGKKTATFDSIKEYNRWNELKIMEKAGEISGLTRQKKLCIQEKFKYHDETIREIAYKADFAYMQNGVQVIEDVKGYDRKKEKYMTTKDFNLKWKLLKYKYSDFDFRIF